MTKKRALVAQILNSCLREALKTRYNEGRWEAMAGRLKATLRGKRNRAIKTAIADHFDIAHEAARQGDYRKCQKALRQALKLLSAGNSRRARKALLRAAEDSQGLVFLKAYVGISPKAYRPLLMAFRGWYAGRVSKADLYGIFNRYGVPKAHRDSMFSALARSDVFRRID
jgi:hypothetical protein